MRTTKVTTHTTHIVEEAAQARRMFVEYLIDASDADTHENFDTPAIVDSLERSYGTTYFNNLNTEQFWAVARNHHKGNK